MALTMYNIKKWYKMLTGKSTLHVKQDIGKCFLVDEIKGYYNDLTEKVTREPKLLESDELPKLKTAKGEEVYFPVAIFQYGLGAYDLFLTEKDEKYLKKFQQCVDWTVKHQEENGTWNNFFYIYPDHPYGAMCQGEGASLLIRAYKQFNNKVYLDAAKKSLEYMILSIEKGGTAQYIDEDLIFLEYTHKPAVLNGWIFAIFGLYDIILLSNDDKFINVFKQSLFSLIKQLPEFDNGYWSLYDLDGKIASPFYHKLHIAQLEALYKITGKEIFKEYADKWNKYQSEFWKPKKAFIKKAIQKVLE